MAFTGRGKSRLGQSFSYAFCGLYYVVKHERNMKIHVVITILVLVLAWLLHLPREDIFVILLLIGGVLSLEAMNTAVEKVVDLVTEEFHPLAKQAKDIAAAAVLIYTIIAVVIGIAIFYKPILNFFTNT
ncbi:diacylglycerol kinase family protein [Bacillus tianshenii]|nr:diacylglycerol kinase family protein [Bacillus tianshenii]